jgi:hypothetical protein
LCAVEPAQRLAAGARLAGDPNAPSGTGAKQNAARPMKKRILTILPLFTACTPTPDNTEPPTIRQTARIASAEITEASGLAQSTRRLDRLWIVNDGGSPPVLHAIATNGETEGSVTLDPGTNVDWEAMASFELDGKSWLLVADTGDNEAVRDISTIYVVEEPPLTENEHAVLPPAWTFSFRWPDGPRDCEAVAVDIANERILLLSKRAVPAVLYELPLRPASDEVITAARLGTVDSLPQPTADDLERAAPERNWHWQPTAMDIARDGSAAVILTYRAVYHFERSNDEPWMDALRKPATVVDLGSIREAEAVVFVDDGRSLLFTVEAPRAPLYRVQAIR